MICSRVPFVGLLAFCLSSLVQTTANAQEQADVQPGQRLSVFDFESDALLPLWSATDTSARLAITREKENVAVGEGALEFTYDATPGAFQQIFTGAFGANSANVLSLQVKASSPTSLSISLVEQGGARYQGLVWIDAGQWVQVRTPLSDLILAQDSSDDNAKLDADQVTGFVLADLANLPGEVGQALGRKVGEQRLWLDQLELAEDRNTRSRGRVERFGDEWLLVLDDFEGPIIWGLPIRQAGLLPTAGAPKTPGRRGLEMTYSLGLGRWVGYVLAPPGRFDLTSTHQLSLWAKTDLNARLVLVLEERDGTKYDTSTKVPTDNQWHNVVLPFDTFAPSDPAGDENSRLDTDQIHRVIVLVDTFDADVRPGGRGSVCIDDIGLVASAAPADEATP